MRVVLRSAVTLSSCATTRTLFTSAKNKIVTADTGVSSLLNESCYQFQMTRRSMSSFKAAVVEEIGKPLQIREMKRKVLEKNQVRLAVYCCGINSVDKYHWLGDVPLKVPFVPGFEVCGEVLEVCPGENTTKMKPGSRVIGIKLDYVGGFAEEMVISAKDVWVVDDSMKFSTGATLVNSYATALIALTRRADVEAGETILVTGAAGRIGSAIVDLAANVYRCKVIGVCADDAKQSEVVRDLGAFATVTMGKQDLYKQVEKITDGEGVKVIIDTVGGDLFKSVVKCLEDEGKIVVAGYASKKIPQISGDDLMQNSYSVLGVSLEQYRKKKYEVYRQAVRDVIDLSLDKLIKPVNSKHFSLDKVNDAMNLLRDGKTIGKIVLDIK